MTEALNRQRRADMQKTRFAPMQQQQIPYRWESLGKHANSADLKRQQEESEKIFWKDRPSDTLGDGLIENTNSDEEPRDSELKRGRPDAPFSPESRADDKIDQAALLNAVSILRHEVCLDRWRQNPNFSELYAGGLNGADLIAFLDRVHGEGVRSGIVTPGMVSVHDAKLYHALSRAAKRERPDLTVSDIFARIGYAPRAASVDRARAVATILGCDASEALTFLRGLFPKPEAKSPGAATPLGTERVEAVEPALTWRDDRLPKETPPEFIERAYSDRLGNGLTRADLLHSDRSLYTALNNWLARNSLPDHIDLPTRKEQTARWVETVRKSAGEHLSDRSAARRYADALVRDSKGRG